MLFVEETVRLYHCPECKRLHTVDGKETLIRIDGPSGYRIEDNHCKAPVPSQFDQAVNNAADAADAAASGGAREAKK